MVGHGQLLVTMVGPGQLLATMVGHDELLVTKWGPGQRLVTMVGHGQRLASSTHCNPNPPLRLGYGVPVSKFSILQLPNKVLA